MIPFAGRIWRIVATGQDATLSVRTAEGRFHHSMQHAIYTSLSAEGCSVAIARYVGPNDPAREIARLRLHARRIVDVRGDSAASMVWQDRRLAGEVAPTWEFSDLARAIGAQGMLYSSRSRPDLEHLVLFAQSKEIDLCVEEVRPWP